MSLFGRRQQQHRRTDSGIEIAEVPEDLRFKRIYTVRLDDRAVLEVSIRKTWRERDATATLTQPNGNSIWFDPDRIAERILDAALVPKIEARVKEVYELDRTEMSNGPSEFRDEDGALWRRAS